MGTRTHGDGSDSSVNEPADGRRVVEVERYWLVHANGGRQLIDPRQFNLEHLAAQARELGGHLVIETEGLVIAVGADPPSPAASRPEGPPRRFEPPVSALGSLFRSRLDRIYRCLVGYEIEINTKPTSRVLGGYYKSRRLIRVYSHDRQTGRRSLEELFDTFLHEIAHHIEYTEPDSFHARECQRVPGRMHSQLFWRILGDLKARWIELQQAR